MCRGMWRFAVVVLTGVKFRGCICGACDTVAAVSERGDDGLLFACLKRWC
jgi:hypothetical protein